MGSPHAQIGYGGIKSLDEVLSTRLTKFKVIALRSKVTRQKFHAHAHPPIMGSPHAQIGHAGINTLDTACPQESQGQGHVAKIKGPIYSQTHSRGKAEVAA